MKKVKIAVAAAILCATLGGKASAAAGEVSVRSLANDGVLVWDGTTRVVVDFPFTGKFDWCVSPTEIQIQALLERKPPFESVDAFLFTHDHVDHFDPALTVKALEAHPRAVLVGTPLILKRVREAGGGRLKNVFFVALEGNVVETAGLKIQVLKAPHARYWDIDPATGKQVIKDDGYVHRAYLVTMAGMSFLHGGDAVEIALPDKAAADYILLDRGILRAKGIKFLAELHQRLGARRTALMHAGPAEFAALKSLVEKESDWLSAITERDQLLSAAPEQEKILGQKPELFLPGLISGPAHDYVVRFNPEMNELYLMRSGLDYLTAILRYRFKVGRWGEPELAPIPFSGSISYPFLSPDGTRLFFGAAEAGSAPDFWTSARKGDGWGKAANLGTNVNSPAVEMLCSVAANGNIYFDSNRPGGQGGFDLYRAMKTPEGYAPAENLGLAVNSADFDAHPFIASDESFLLFDSRRPGGQGGNDLYVSFRNPDGTWAPALNLGPEINTPAGDMRAYVAPDGKTLYFCSDRSLNNSEAKPASLEEFNRKINGPGNGSQDIWRVSLDVVKRLRGR